MARCFQNVSRSRSRFAALIAAVMIIIEPAGSRAADHSCSEYRALDQAYKLVPMDGTEDSVGIEHFRSEDIDRDGHPDDIEVSCPNGGSLIPPDPCTLSIKLTKANTTLYLEEERLVLFKSDGVVYVRTSVIRPPEHPRYMRRAIYRITPSKIQLICSGYVLPL